MNKYFLEIKNRFILLCITGIAVFFTGVFYKEILLFILIQPNLTANELMNTFYFIFTHVLEILLIYLQLMIFFFIQINFIFTFYHIFIFLGSGFFYFEYLYFKFYIKIVFIFWFIVILLTTFILIPFSWNFFLNFQNLIITKSFNLHFEAKLNQYFNFYISFYYLCEFYCQFFLFFLFFFDYTKSNISTIKKFRKFYYYFFIIISTLISPPDITNHIAISVACILIHEFLIFFYLFKLIK